MNTLLLILSIFMSSHSDDRNDVLFNTSSIAFPVMNSHKHFPTGIESLDEPSYDAISLLLDQNNSAGVLGSDSVEFTKVKWSSVIESIPGITLQTLTVDRTIPHGTSSPIIIYDQINERILLVYKVEHKAWMVEKGAEVGTMFSLSKDEWIRNGIAWTPEADGSYLVWHRGIGAVSLYDKDFRLQKVLLDEEDRRSFVSVAFFSGPEGTLYNVGGYGLWEYKNLVLRFNRDKADWEVMPARSGQIPEPAQQGYGAVSASGKIYYLIQAEREGRTMIFYEYDLESGHWTQYFEIDLDVPLSKESILMDNSSFNIYDAETHTIIVQILVLVDGTPQPHLLLIQPRSQTVKLINVEILGINPNKLTHWKKTEDDKWVLVSLRPTQQMIVDLLEFDTESILRLATPQKVYSNSINPLLYFLMIVGGFVLVTLVVTTIGNRKRRLKKPEWLHPKLHEAVILTKSGENMTVRIGGKVHDLGADQAYHSLWTLIHTAVIEGRSELPITTVDDVLFKNLKQLPQKTRLRYKYIHIINKESGKTLLEIKRSKVDQRFKVLSISLNDFRVEEE